MKKAPSWGLLRVRVELDTSRRLCWNAACKHQRSRRDSFLGRSRRVFVLDRDRPDPPFREEGQEAAPPFGVVAAADRGERPRRTGIARGPPPVEQPVDGELVLVEDDVLCVRVADA